MAIPLFTRLIYKGDPIKVWDGTTKRDYTNVHDVVDGIARILMREFKYEVFNLGTANPVPLLSLIDKIAEKLDGKDFQIKWTYGGEGEAQITYADISKAKEMLGYSPKYNIDNGLREYVDWYLKEVEHAV